MHQRTPEALRVDVGSVTTGPELHRLLAESFRFPGYYGGNWNAFDECIREVELPPRIEISGLETLRARLPREAELLQQCLSDFARETAHNIILRTA
jgi:ribonuclease inhibitor